MAAKLTFVEQEWTSQPLYKVSLADKYKDAAFAYLPSVSRWTTLNGATLGKTGEAPAFSIDAHGIFVHAITTERQNIDILLRYADNTLDGATLIAIQRVSDQSVFAGWHTIQTDSINSHLPYSGSVYLSTFSSSRWLNGTALPSGVDKPHACIVVANGTSRSLYMVNKLVGTGTADTKVRFTTCSIGGISPGFPLMANTYALVMLPRAISDEEARSIMANPWKIFEPEQIPLFKPTVTAQYARPISDVSAGGWTASTGSDLYAMLDETSANDSDYITSTTASTCEVALGSLSDPALSTGHIVRYRISATGGGIVVRLRQGTTTIASWTHDPAPGSLTTYAQTLSSGEADAITDYSALRLQFEATA